MRQIFIFASFCGLMFIVFGCNQRNSADGVVIMPRSADSIIFLDEGPYENSYIDLSDAISDIELIQLETTDSSIFAVPSILLRVDSNLVIADKMSDKILMFNGSGKYEKLIATLGKGPGEYQSISDVNYNKWSRKIEIWDNKWNFLTYDLASGEITSTSYRNLDFFVYGFFMPTAMASYFLYNPQYTNMDDKNDFRLAYIKDGRIKWKLLPFNQTDEKGITGANYFYKYEDSVRFFERFIPVVYTIDSLGIVPRYFFQSTGRAAIDRYDLNRYSDYMKKQEQGGLAIGGIYETRGWLFISFLVNRNIVKYALVDKSNYKNVRYADLGFSIDGLMVYLKTVIDNEIWASVESPTLLAYQSEIGNRKTLSDFQKAILNVNVKDTDNPVLMKFGIDDE